MSLQHFLADQLQDKQQLEALIAQAIDIKSNPGNYSQALAGKSIVMLFEKPSLRTHISFDIGIEKLGGHSLYIGQQNGQLGERERVKDVAKNLACWSDAIVARVFKQQVLDEMAEHAGVPVINALSDLYHPCQALADYMALTETFGSVENLNVAYIGDGNNVSNSLMLMGSILGANVTVITPQGYEPDSYLVAIAAELAEQSGAKLTVSTNIEDAKNQQVIYTDTWISMGDNTKVDAILEKFMPYQINAQLMAKAGATAVMHCQPAHLEQEITTEVFDSEQSLAFLQAENRMWAQNSVLVSLFK
ncbi:ornithine carbamoyltransferase [Thalassotalea sp. ND16A]|uniref:ornithine carbamoyltransferase n=1 Tax=Thalassotalea sp. ND16A TaxID=1535422 RepID=UPI00051A3C6C|nr:ornithine carbamoyltransferase [Thalassotalea sp. ND16A]KGK01072.1 Ornithine carbamoyltransferase [Thalassotalea sp. ND16A]